MLCIVNILNLRILCEPLGFCLCLQSKQETVQLETRQRSPSGRSGASYGTLGAGSRSGMHRQGSSMILKRTSSTATTDKPFEKPEIHSIVSGKSLASIRTRLTSISRSEYHEDLKPTLASVSKSFASYFSSG